MKFLVSGLLNVETTCPVRGFPINYYPIDYVFFGIDTKASGVALNVSKALKIRFNGGGLGFLDEPEVKDFVNSRKK